LVNLEKDIGLCTYLNRIRAKTKYGFYFNTQKHDIATYHRSARYLLSGQEHHRNIRKALPEILFEAVGGRWNGEMAIFQPRVSSKEKYDIGFNFAVGPKWPTKAWPMEKWKALEKILNKRYTISWQKGHKDIRKYIQWVSSCSLIVTCDSLGQILGQALGKKVITLFGPTNHLRMKGMPNTTVIPSPLKCPFMPCYLPVCKYHKFCMDYISPQMVASECEKVLRATEVTT
jgi:heptosyltransferase-2